MPVLLLVVLCGAFVLCACTGGGGVVPTPTPSPRATPAPAPTPAPTPTPTAPSTPEPEAAPAPPPDFDPAAAFAVVQQLAGDIGAREAASGPFATAADVVAEQLQALGYTVRREVVPVPAGVSWGVPVPAGTTQNVVAEPLGYVASNRHRLIGAHLDTVPQAPGAEDNASGVGVLLELARIAAAAPPAVPVVFVAFGGEEPRGPGDAMHHFGSQQMVATMDEAHRGALAGMVSLDRVGVPADAVPACYGGRGSAEVREELAAAAGRIGVPVQRCENRASDHWSFEKAGVPAARLGSVPYPGYHSPADVASVVDPGQLDRVGRILAEWMSATP